MTRVPGGGAPAGGQPAQDGEPVIVPLPIAIDVTNTVQVFNRLSAAVTSEAPVIIADRSATVSCDAAGVYHLHAIGSSAAARGGRLRLVIPPGAPPRQMLVLLGVDHLLPVYSSTGEAREPLAGPRHPLPPRPAARERDRGGSAERAAAFSSLPFRCRHAAAPAEPAMPLRSRRKRSRFLPRCSRDITVPTGTPVLSAISA